MEYIYFDQNVWSNLTDLRKHDTAEYEAYVERIAKLKNLEVVYSLVNVKKTLRRNYPAEIERELAIISEITSNCLMQENGKIVVTTPMLLSSKIALDNYLFLQFSECTKKYVPQNNSAIDPSIKRKQNDIPINTAADEVLHKFISQIGKQKDTVDFSLLDMICSSLDQKIKELCKERAKVLGDYEGVEKCAAAISSVLTFSKEMAEITTKEAVEKKTLQILFQRFCP